MASTPRRRARRSSGSWEAIRAATPISTPGVPRTTTLSLEYYANRSTLINFALFYINVKSFINNGSVQRCDLPDQDGVVRNRCVAINEPIQGAGANLKGAELGIKQAFDFLPGFLARLRCRGELHLLPE